MQHIYLASLEVSLLSVGVIIVIVKCLIEPIMVSDSQCAGWPWSASVAPCR